MSASPSPPMLSEHHPLALGIPKTKGSHFVRELAGAHLSIIRVLMKPGADPPEQAVNELPRGRGPRPDVYCPFCGRLGKYSHTDNYDHFSHISSQDECSPHDLETVLHLRAKQLLLEQMTLARTQNRPIEAQIKCNRCGKTCRARLCQQGSWDQEGLELSLADGIRPDLTLLKDGGLAFFYEVYVTHKVGVEKDARLKAAQYSGVEIDAHLLFDEAGQAVWHHERVLPLPRASWGLEAYPRKLNVCGLCRKQTSQVKATAKIIGILSEDDPNGWTNLVEQSGLPGAWRIALIKRPSDVIFDHTCAPEILRDKDSIDAAELSPCAVHQKLFVALKSHFGEAVTSHWSSFEDLLKDPFSSIAAEIGELADDISGNTERLSTSEPNRQKSLTIAELIHQKTSSPDSLSRAQSWIGHALLTHSSRYGNTLKKSYSLTSWPGKLFERSNPSLFQKWTKWLQESNFITTLKIGETHYVALKRLATKERNIATQLLEIRNRRRLQCTFQKRDGDLKARQRAAVTSLAENPVAIVHGAAGTGKSRVVKAIVSAYKQIYWIILAPTGKAAETLRSVVDDNQNCAIPLTFAKLISNREILYDFRDRGPLGVILDEAGFISVEGFDSLLNTIKGHPIERLVLAGDPNQLPSIGPGWVLGDLITWAKGKRHGIAETELNEIVRSNEELALIAGQVRVGKFPDLGSKLTLSPPSDDLDVQVATAVQDLENRGSEHVQVICATRDLVKCLNATLQEKHNARGRPLQSQPDLRLGDLVICTENYYGIANLFNGQQARIEGESAEALVLSSHGVTINLPIDEASKLALGYALTVHKAQGSEWDSVIFVLPRVYKPPFMCRPLIYTALTRSKKDIHVISTEVILTKAIESGITRETALVHWLQCAYQAPPLKARPTANGTSPPRR